MSPNSGLNGSERNILRGTENYSGWRDRITEKLKKVRWLTKDKKDMIEDGSDTDDELALPDL
ncbi:hypothetical protein HDV02_004777, partial [Globomyces sp. JEL0801]